MKYIIQNTQGQKLAYVLDEGWEEWWTNLDITIFSNNNSFADCKYTLIHARYIFKKRKLKTAKIIPLGDNNV